MAVKAAAAAGVAHALSGERKRKCKRDDDKNVIKNKATISIFLRIVKVSLCFSLRVMIVFIANKTS